MKVEAIGDAGLSGWREKVGDAVARPVGRHTRVDVGTVRSAVGLLFLGLSCLYLLRTVRRVVAS